MRRAGCLGAGPFRQGRALTRAPRMHPFALSPGPEHPRVSSDVVIFVCTSCKREGDAPEAPRAGAALGEAVAAAGPHRVQFVKCLSNCSRGPSAALVRPGGWSYVFGGLEAEGAAAALQEGAALLGASEDGTMPWKTRPEILKRQMIARIPPFDFTPAETAP